MNGTVTDPTGKSVPHAAVAIVNVETGYARSVRTGDSGQFAAPALPVGKYSVSVTAAGFTAAKRDGVLLSVGALETVHVRLSVETVSEQVTVDERQDDLQAGEAAATQILNSGAVESLPVRGRNFVEFCQLTPGLVQEADRSGMIIAGQRSINSNVSIDGADFNDPVQGNQRGGNQSVFFFPQAAVREFQVIRSGVTAEVGRTGAGFVNVVTRSGANSTHGEALYQNRNKTLSSPDAFDRKLNNQQNQFGGAIGGPLKKDKAFYFVAMEQNFLRVPFVVKFNKQPAGVTVPANLAALEGEQRGTNNPTSLFARNDVTLNSRHSLQTTYNYSRTRGDNFNFDSPQLSEAATTNYQMRITSHGGKVGLVSVLSPSLVSDARMQIATDFRDEHPNSELAQLNISGFGLIGGDKGRPRIFESTRYQATENLSWNSGPHSLRVGFDYNANHVRQMREDNVQGRYDYKSLSDYIAGKISRYRQTLAVPGPGFPFLDGYQHETAAFAQYKVQFQRGIALTAGLRWEGQWNPQPPVPNAALAATGRIPNDLRQWQPRLGLVIPAGSSTVVRLSSGFYNSRTPANLFQRVWTDNGISTVVLDTKFDPQLMSILPYPNRFAAVPAGVKIPAAMVFGFEAGFKNPTTVLTSAALEHAFKGQLSVSAEYLHGSTWNLQRRVDRNLLPPTIDATGMPIFPSARPFPAFGRIGVNESSAHSRYDGLILSVQKRMTRRIQFQANYTLSRTLDDDSNERNWSRETALNPFDLSIERGYSKQDVRHYFRAASTINLPKAFTFSAITLTRSAFPYTAVVGYDTQNDGNDDNDRAIINGKVVGRNTFRQDPFFDLDLRVGRNFRIGEKAVLQVTGDFFNVTRAPNKHFGNDSISEYGTPSAPVATAGQPLYAPSSARYGGPRQIQLGARFVF